MTFNQAFKRLEELNINDIQIFNTNEKYITDTPDYMGNIEHFKNHKIYNSDETIEKLLLGGDNATILYFRH